MHTAILLPPSVAPLIHGHESKTQRRQPVHVLGQLQPWQASRPLPSRACPCLTAGFWHSDLHVSHPLPSAAPHWALQPQVHCCFCTCVGVCCPAGMQTLHGRLPCSAWWPSSAGQTSLPRACLWRSEPSKPLANQCRSRCCHCCCRPAELTHGHLWCLILTQSLNQVASLRPPNTLLLPAQKLSSGAMKAACADAAELPKSQSPSMPGGRRRTF
mmetsp:Transcript_12342/g.33679  ORF Transcript_12342/g.33679 Transcript_12342/m.33679 type:complete len:214 (-) Transcript_12342:1952-2593(-)